MFEDVLPALIERAMSDFRQMIELDHTSLITHLRAKEKYTIRWEVKVFMKQRIAQLVEEHNNNQPELAFMLPLDNEITVSVYTYINALLQTKDELENICKLSESRRNESLLIDQTRRQ